MLAPQPDIESMTKCNRARSYRNALTLSSTLRKGVANIKNIHCKVIPRTSRNKTANSALKDPTSRALVMNASMLESCYHLPLHVAAKRLGICSTALKRVCRKIGLKQWPFRKIKALDRKICEFSENHNYPPGEHPGNELVIPREISARPNFGVTRVNNAMIGGVMSTLHSRDNHWLHADFSRATALSAPPQLISYFSGSHALCPPTVATNTVSSYTSQYSFQIRHAAELKQNLRFEPFLPLPISRDDENASSSAIQQSEYADLQISFLPSRISSRDGEDGENAPSSAKEELEYADIASIKSTSSAQFVDPFHDDWAFW